MGLSQHQQGWAEIEALETQLLRQLTIEEGIQQFLALQREFEPQLQATEETFRQPRIQAMIQLQARLAALTGNHHIGASMESLDDRYVENWLHLFEQALDDSTLVAEYRRLRRQLI